MDEHLTGSATHRGFAAMDEKKQREIAGKGGRAAHQKGTAHQFTSEEARVAGRKGGQTVSQDRAHMAEIGRQGGHARGHRRAEEETTSFIANAPIPLVEPGQPLPGARNSES